MAIPVPPEVTASAVPSVAALNITLLFVSRLWLIEESPSNVKVFDAVPPDKEKPMAFGLSPRVLNVEAVTAPVTPSVPATVALPLTARLPAEAAPVTVSEPPADRLLSASTVPEM